MTKDWSSRDSQDKPQRNSGAHGGIHGALSSAAPRKEELGKTYMFSRKE